MERVLSCFVRSQALKSLSTSGLLCTVYLTVQKLAFLKYSFPPITFLKHLQQLIVYKQMFILGSLETCTVTDLFKFNFPNKRLSCFLWLPHLFCFQLHSLCQRGIPSLYTKIKVRYTSFVYKLENIWVEKVTFCTCEHSSQTESMKFEYKKLLKDNRMMKNTLLDINDLNFTVTIRRSPWGKKKSRAYAKIVKYWVHLTLEEFCSLKLCLYLHCSFFF